MLAPQYLHTRHIDADIPGGYHLAQLALACGIACQDRRRTAVQVTQDLFVNDGAALAVARVATGVADTSTATWVANLVRADTHAMLRDVAPLSVWARLATAGTALRLNGSKGAVVPAVPLYDPGMEPAWVGEEGVIPLLKGTVSGARITRNKLAGIIPVTQELARTSDALEAMRQLLRQAAANLLDRSILDAAAAMPDVRPAGLLHGVTPIAGASGGGLGAMATDIAALCAAFAAAGVGADVVLIVNSGTRAALGVLTNGTLGGQQIIGSPLVPAGTCIAVDAAYFASAFEPIELDVNGAVALTLADAGATAPTQSMDNAGALGTAHQVLPDRGVSVAGGMQGAATAGYQAVSLWQTMALGIRLVWPAGFAVTLPGAVQALSGITWTTAPAIT